MLKGRIAPSLAVPGSAAVCLVEAEDSICGSWLAISGPVKALTRLRGADGVEALGAIAPRFRPYSSGGEQVKGLVRALHVQTAFPEPSRGPPASRDKQQRSSSPMHRSLTQARFPTYGFLGETTSGRQVQASESPALRGFHGPGRTRTCVLRIMSYVSGVAPGLLRPYSVPGGVLRCPEFSAVREIFREMVSLQLGSYLGTIQLCPTPAFTRKQHSGGASDDAYTRLACQTQSRRLGGGTCLGRWMRASR